METLRRLPILVLGCAILGFACSGGGPDDPDEDEPEGSGAPPAELIGTWIFQSVEVDGVTAPLADVLEWVPGAVEARITVESNSAYVYEEVDMRGGQLWVESGFVFVDGNEIDVNVLLDSDGSVNEMTVLTFTLSGDQLTLQEIDQGTTVLFTLTRSP